MEKEAHKTSSTSSLNQDKHAQVHLLQKENDLVNARMWSLFEKCISNMVQLLVEETNQYAIIDKNKPEFNINIEEMMKFIGFIF